MASSQNQETSAPAGRPEGHPSADLFVENKRLLDKRFKDLEDMFMARCPRCRPQSPEAWTKNEWTDNDRLPMKWEIISSKALPSLSTLTPRQLLQQNFGAEVQFRCSVCDKRCGEIVLSDTPEKLYNDLRNFICHDMSLPLLFHPREADPDIPADAARCCEMAHMFPVEEHLTLEVLSRIERSLVAGALHKVLLKKMAGAMKKHGDPYKSYIRIGLLFKPLGRITAVLELWPSGHSSPKHQHGGCAGSVRLVHGDLRMKLYKTLQTEEPMKVPGSNEGGTIEMQAPATTWLNRSNWFVHSVESPAQSNTVNRRGFALSLHVYLSCTDEFAFTVDREGSQASSTASSRAPEKKNPPNDFVWVIPGFPTNDERALNIPSFNDQVLSSSSDDVTDMNAKAWLDLGIYRNGGKVKCASYNAKECCVRSLELDPADPMAWWHLGICGGGSVNGARWAAWKCRYHAQYEFGRLYRQGFFFKSCYIRALELDPDNAMAWLGLGMCGGGGGGEKTEKILGGSYLDPMTCYIRAVELDPDVSPVVWDQLGWFMPSFDIIVIKGTSYNKKKCCIRALEVDPEYSEGWKNLGEVGGGSVNGTSYDMMACYHRALELDPKDA